MTITYTQEDCMVGMARYPDKYFDLAIVDPPYGININMNMGLRKGEKPKHERKKWDKQTPDQIYFDELYRVSKHQIIWGGNYFSLPLTKSWLFWDKRVPAGVSFADGELAWTSFDVTLRKIDLPYTGFTGMDTDGRIHPTQKPVALYKWLLTNYAKPGDKILDTHVGSASSLIACYDMGFEAVGFELDEDYYRESKQRLERFMSQLRLTDYLDGGTER